MRYIALLRGVMPKGKNSIPKMSDLVCYLTEAGLEKVETYIQSGNILFESDHSPAYLQALIHDTIKRCVGADLSVILKTPLDFEKAVAACPFSEGYDSSRIHLTFTNDEVSATSLEVLKTVPLQGEELVCGEDCFYLYLPRDAAKKRLNTNALEKRLNICATTRKLSVVKRLIEKSL